MLFTTAIVCDIQEVCHGTRFCYETRLEAIDALAAWDGRGDPPGLWIKEKPAGRAGPGMNGARQ